MNVRDIIKQLTAMGHKVSFFVRKDGGVRITRIDDNRFTGSQGNAMARTIIGVSLSQRRQQQLESIRTPQGQFGHYKNKKNDILPEEIIKKVKSVQRLFRVHDVKAKKSTITMRNIRYTYKEYGYQEAMRRLSQASKYARGIAYDENIDGLIDRLKQSKPSSDEYEQLIIDSIIELLKDKKESGNFTTDMLNTIVDPEGKLYQWFEGRNGITIDDVYNEIKSILKL